MSGLLFSESELHAVLRTMEAKLNNEVQAMAEASLTDSAAPGAAEVLAKRYALRVPTLLEAGIIAEAREAEIDVSSDPRYMAFGRGPQRVRGMVAYYRVPVEGDAKLFECKPSQFTFNPPRAEVRRMSDGTTSLVFSYTSPTATDGAAMKSQFERDLFEVRRWLEWVRSDVSQYNASLQGRISRAMEARREELRRNKEFAAGLGYPTRLK